MAQIICDLPVLLIPNGASSANAIGLFDDATALTIYSPPTLTNVVTVQVEPTATGTSFVALQSGGVDVTLPAGKATVFNKVGWRQMSLQSAGVEGQDDTFRVTKSVTIG